MRFGDLERDSISRPSPLYAFWAIPTFIYTVHIKFGVGQEWNSSTIEMFLTLCYYDETLWSILA